MAILRRPDLRALPVPTSLPRRSAACPACKALVPAGAAAGHAHFARPRDDDDEPPRSSKATARDDAAESETSSKALWCLLLSIGNFLCLPLILSLPS